MAINGRMGDKFHNAIEEIKDLKLKNGTAKDRVSTEKLTNLLIKHKNWPDIFRDLTLANEKEVNNYGQ